MKSIRSLGLALALGLIAAVSTAVNAAAYAYREVRDWLTEKAFAFVAGVPRQAEAVKHMQAVPFVQARAFVARLIKRERPVLTSDWRMCPSI